MALSTQIHIYSLDTSSFYTNEEKRLHRLNHKIRVERNHLINGFIEKGADGKTKRIICGTKEILKELKKYGMSQKECDSLDINNLDSSKYGEDRDKVAGLVERYHFNKFLIDLKGKQARASKERLLALLSNKVEANTKMNGKHHIRELREKEISEKNIISVFESSFTRMIKAKPDELCEDFMVIQVYYFSIIQDLIYHGFMYKGEKYIYFTSSAGQIRTKKAVFVKESVWKTHEKTIMCGLTMDEINAKGGSNPNKYLAYMALTNSATDVWEEFDIDKTIVIEDFETEVFGIYDFIDDTDYSIRRTSGVIPITHTDGAGMMLPNAFGKTQRNKMIRAPFVKGLLGVFDFVKFIQANNCTPIVKDIYGQEHDVIAEDIQVIFTESQFKMYKYYASWEQYKKLYKQYGCTAGYTNEEEERIKDATINYQMLQSLTDISDDEIYRIAEPSIEKLNNLCSSVEHIKEAFGCTPYNTNKTAFQKSVELYPELLNDGYVRNKLKDIKDSMVKNYKSGKLQVHGKYTFILPDFYAACQHWFMGLKNPEGLLEDGEVFCWLFRKNEKLDCLRSPHLFMEHPIRTNMAWNGYADRQQRIREWFVTDALYASCKDLISKIIMYDVDGDKSLVVADELLISVVERNIKRFDIVPLYYNMKKALPAQLNSQTIYDGLNAAFTGGNIGIYSNNISKIWNSEVFISGSQEEKMHALNCIKRLCCQNNFVIDYAKTLYKPEFPQEISKEIKEFTRQPLPHFFKYAKDKEDHQVQATNSSFVNRLDVLIPNPRINCKYIKADGKKKALGKPVYQLMMSNPDLEIALIRTESGRLIEGTNPVILKYLEKAKIYGQKMSDIAIKMPRDAATRSQIRKAKSYQEIIKDVRAELSKFGYSESEVADILVKYLYESKDNRRKELLWTCYGEYILANLEKHFKARTKAIQCVDCGEWFGVSVYDSATCRCEECQGEHRRELARLRKQKQRCHATLKNAQTDYK